VFLDFLNIKIFVQAKAFGDSSKLLLVSNGLRHRRGIKRKISVRKANFDPRAPKMTQKKRLKSQALY
jgi:hypothetical protein